MQHLSHVMKRQEQLVPWSLLGKALHMLGKGVHAVTTQVLMHLEPAVPFASCLAIIYALHGTMSCQVFKELAARPKSSSSARSLHLTVKSEYMIVKGSNAAPASFDGIVQAAVAAAAATNWICLGLRLAMVQCWLCFAWHYELPDLQETSGELCSHLYNIL